jgi:hypothetical protein
LFYRKIQGNIFQTPFNHYHPAAKKETAGVRMMNLFLPRKKSVKKVNRFKNSF